MKRKVPTTQDNIPVLVSKLKNTEKGSLQWNHYWRQFDLQVAKFLWSVCRNTVSISSSFSEEELKDLVSDTRHKIYSNLDSFNLPPDITEKEAENRFKKFFTKILRNVSYDTQLQKNKESGIFVRLEDFDTDAYSSPDEAENKLSPQKQHLLELIYEATKLLSKRDKDIWQTYALNRDSKGRIPEYLLHHIESKYKLKPGYSSKIYNRCNDKIKNHIKSQLYEKTDSNDTGDDEVSG